MMQNELCSTCKNWNPDVDKKWGDCQAHPRQAYVKGSGSELHMEIRTSWEYPRHIASDGCGEWKPVPKLEPEFKKREMK